MKISDSSLSTLQDYSYKNKYIASSGEHGKGKNMHGKNGPDILIKVPIGTIVKDVENDGNPRKFKIRYPGLFRMGVSKQLDPDLLIAGDLVAGFSDRLGVHQQWKISTGLEFSRFKSIPMRIGYMYAGKYLKELGFGAGLHAGPIIYDFGISFRNGIWIHNMKGISVSFGVALTSFKSRKNKKPED